MRRIVRKDHADDWERERRQHDTYFRDTEEIYRKNDTDIQDMRERYISKVT